MVKKSTAKTNAGVQSLERGIALLDIVVKAKDPIRLKDLADQADMSLSLAHSYLASLSRTGLLNRDPASGLYDLGDTSLQLGLVALSRMDLARLARQALAHLGALEDTVVVSVWSEGGPQIIDKLEGQRDSIFEIRVGKVMPTATTSTGRMFMAFLKEEKWHSLLDKGEGNEKPSRAKQQAAITELPKIRRDLISVPIRNSSPNFPGVAVPVFDHQNNLKGVLTMMGRAGSFTINVKSPSVVKLRETAQKISKRLGWVAPD